MSSTLTNKAQGASLNSLKAKVQSNPKDGESWLAIAMVLARFEPGPELRQAINKSIELQPDEHQAWLLAGLDLQQRQEPAAAQQWLQQIAQQQPTLVAPRLAAAQLLMANQAEKATQSFNSVIKDFPNDARAHLLFAEHLQNQGKLREAADQLEKALAIKPDVAENWAALAMLRLAERRYDAVVIAASKALELDITADEARLSRAEAYRQAAQWDLALADYRQANKSMPNNPFILLGSGACMAGRGEYDEALHLLKKAVQIKPDLAEVRLNIALVLASQDKSNEALKVLQTVLRQPGLSATLKDATVIAQSVLQENRRLKSVVSGAVESGDLTDMQKTLAQAPEALLQSDPQSSAQFQAMAQACQKWRSDESGTRDSPNDQRLEPELLAMAEACLLCRAADTGSDMANIWHAIRLGQSNVAALDDMQRRVLRVWRSVLDRRHLPTVVDDRSKGEACLRYWHFRIMAGSAASLPGLFKFTRNSIGLHQTTAPQHLIAAVRMMMNESAPCVPAGEARGSFMLAAISRTHAFVDGNGRLARFVFNGELERAGSQAMLFLPTMRKTLASCLDAAQYRHDFQPFQQFLLQARVGTRILLDEFKDRLG
ncbi:MAG: tetratricopeptide repeat protein [Xanthomonadales bacterium]|nr:tetratricopeptide repeat protein [Xanthomonadales bacterium]